MPYIRHLGLAAMALAALTGFAGTASATILTSPSGTVYTGEILAENEGAFTVESSFIGMVNCTESKIKLKLESAGTNVTAAGKISEFICTGGSVTSPVVKPGTLEFHGTTTTGNGTVTWNGGEMVLHNTLAGTCTLVTSNTDIGTLTGSNVTKGNAKLDVSGVALRTNGSAFCGESATWTVSYKVTTPSTLEVH